MPKPSDVGVIVGRFQVHRLHAAHTALIQSVYDTHPHTVVVLGLSQVRVSTRNPLDFEARKQLILDAFPKATVFYVKDEPTDIGWSVRLDALIGDYASPAQTVTLYGGRDSFVSHYQGRYPVEILEPETYVSGTELRKTIARRVKASEDFRAGVIWAASNGYPKVFPTVDVAIYRPRYVAVDRSDWPAEDGKEWLLVRKPHEIDWRFPGGFVQPSDGSWEAAARREVAEETGASIGDPRYVWSGLVDDWRYRAESDKILTTLFAAPFVSGPVRPADDIAEAKWVRRMNVVGEYAIVHEHLPLLDALVKGGLV